MYNLLKIIEAACISLHVCTTHHMHNKEERLSSACAMNKHTQAQGLLENNKFFFHEWTHDMPLLLYAFIASVVFLIFSSYACMYAYAMHT